MTISSVLPFFYAIATILGLGVTIGALIFAMRGGYSKEASTMQKQAIESLTALNDAQSRQMEAQDRQLATKDKEIARQRSILETITTLTSLKRRSLHIEINGETVTLVDEKSGRMHTERIRKAEEQTPEEST